MAEPEPYPYAARLDEVAALARAAFADRLDAADPADRALAAAAELPRALGHDPASERGRALAALALMVATWREAEGGPRAEARALAGRKRSERASELASLDATSALLRLAAACAPEAEQVVLAGAPVPAGDAASWYERARERCIASLAPALEHAEVTGDEVQLAWVIGLALADCALASDAPA